MALSPVARETRRWYSRPRVVATYCSELSKEFLELLFARACLVNREFTEHRAEQHREAINGDARWPRWHLDSGAQIGGERLFRRKIVALFCRSR
jgi:hypothetical protein